MALMWQRLASCFLRCYPYTSPAEAILLGSCEVCCAEAASIWEA